MGGSVSTCSAGACTQLLCPRPTRACWLQTASLRSCWLCLVLRTASQRAGCWCHCVASNECSYVCCACQLCRGLLFAGWRRGATRIMAVPARAACLGHVGPNWAVHPPASASRTQPLRALARRGQVSPDVITHLATFKPPCRHPAAWRGGQLLGRRRPIESRPRWELKGVCARPLGQKRSLFPQVLN